MFLAALGIFVAVTAVVCYGIGKVINAHLNKEDGPTPSGPRRWTSGNSATCPRIRACRTRWSSLRRVSPRRACSLDDGNQDVADLHARENLLLEHYSWIDEQQGTVRIPIERAMELLAQQGLPVARPVTEQPLMTGDSRPVVTAPLTDGFAPTGFEQEEAQERAAEAARGEQSK